MVPHDRDEGAMTPIREIAPHVPALAEHYSDLIMRRAAQHHMAVGDEATAALYASLACLFSACDEDVDEFKRIANMALDAVIGMSLPSTGDEE